MLFLVGARIFQLIESGNIQIYIKANISGGMQIILSFLTIFGVVFEIIIPWGELYFFIARLI